MGKNKEVGGKNVLHNKIEIIIFRSTLLGLVFYLKVYYDYF